MKRNSLGGKYLTMHETADYLGVTDRTVRSMVADGSLKGDRLGARVVRLRIDEIDATLQPLGGAA